MWEFITKVLKSWSIYSFASSLITHNMSKRESIGSERSTFCLNDSWELYLPWIGFAAAITEHLALKEVTIPALEIEILCCYIASWIDVLSCSFILSN